MTTSFFISPPGSRLKVQCRIYPTQKEMLRGVRKDVVGGIANSTMACCVHQTKSTVEHDNLAAVVFFSKTHLDADTIAHEMVHAAHNIVQRRRRNTENQDMHEEELATVTGELVGAFNRKAFPLQ